MRIRLISTMTQAHPTGHIYANQSFNTTRRMKYDQPGDVYMHFFPNAEVRVVVSPDGPGAPSYPIRHFGKPQDGLLQTDH